MKNKLSIFVVPTSGKVRQFSVSKSLTVLVASAIVTYTILSLILSVDFVARRVDSGKVESLTKENQLLTARLTDIDQTITDLRNQIGSLTEKEKAIRTIFDLPEIDPQQRQLGIGGPDLLPEDERPSPSLEIVYQSEAELDRLIALTSFEKQQFNEIYAKLFEKRSRLDRTPSIMPTQGYLMRGFGVKRDPFTGFAKMHTGLDISNRIGTPVVATANGTVTFVGWENGLGKKVVVDHGDGIQTVYGHLSQWKVKEGQQVLRGEVVALMGNTGYSTGPHLHYEVIRFGATVNPLDYIYTLAELN